MTCSRHGGNDIGSIFCKFCDADVATIDRIRQADARRIVACVNALEGVPTAMLEGSLLTAYPDLIAERDAALEQVKVLQDALDYWLPTLCPLLDQHDSPSETHKMRWYEARAALAKGMT